MKFVFEDDIIRVVDNERDYDFIGYIENISDEDIKIVFSDVDYEDYPLYVKANDWVGFSADSMGYDMFELVKNGDYTIQDIEEEIKEDIDNVLRQMCFGRSREYSAVTVEKIYNTCVIYDNCIMDNICVDEDIIVSALMEIVFRYGEYTED